MQESLKIKVFVSPLVRSQLEMDVQDYKLRGLGELCNRIIARFPELESMRKGESSEELYKNCPPLQFYVRKENADFLRFAQERNFKKGTLCRHYFEEYVNLSRGDRECFFAAGLVAESECRYRSQGKSFYRLSGCRFARCALFCRVFSVSGSGVSGCLRRGKSGFGAVSCAADFPHEKRCGGSEKRSVSPLLVRPL